jgi:hypothetical protein
MICNAFLAISITSHHKNMPRTKVFNESSLQKAFDIKPLEATKDQAAVAKQTKRIIAKPP